MQAYRNFFSPAILPFLNQNVLYTIEKSQVFQVLTTEGKNQLSVSPVPQFSPVELTANTGQKISTPLLTPFSVTD